MDSTLRSKHFLTKQPDQFNYLFNTTFFYSHIDLFARNANMVAI